MGIRQIYVERIVGELEQWDLSEKEQTLHISVVVVWDSGEELVLYQEEGREKYSYHPPSIPEAILRA